MRDFRRLPPLLRVAAVLGLMLPLASLALLSQMLVAALPTLDWPSDFSRVSVVASSLVMLGLACTFVSTIYSTRFRYPQRRSFPLDSWQSQVRTIVLLAALPLCVFAWAIFVPATTPGFGNVYLLSIVAWVVLVGVGLWMFVRYQAS